MSAAGGLLGLAPAVYRGYVGPIDGNGATRIAVALAEARNSQCSAVHLALSSPGGQIPEGIYLYNLIRSFNINLHMHNLSQIGSIALVSFLAADRRTCSPNAMFHAHPAFGVPLQGSAKALNSAVACALLEEKRIEAILRERTQLPRKLLNARRSGDIHLTADDALKYGFVNAIEDFTLPEGVKYVQI